MGREGGGLPGAQPEGLGDVSPEACEVTLFKGTEGIAILDDCKEFLRDAENDRVINTEGGPLRPEGGSKGPDRFEVFLVNEKEKACFQNGLLRDASLAGGCAGSLERILVAAFEEGLQDFLLSSGGAFLSGVPGRIFLSEPKLSKEARQDDESDCEKASERASQLLFGI